MLNADPPLPEPEPEPPDPLLEPDPLPLPELDPELPELELPLLEEVVATEEPVPLFKLEIFPIPLPESSLADILDKSENIGLSLLVIPYAATAAAIHKTTIIEIIRLALSILFPPSKYNKIF